MKFLGFVVITIHVAVSQILDTDKKDRGELEGIMITGGSGGETAVEIYIPPLGPFPSFQCQLLPMPASRSRHTQTGLRACGGGYPDEQRSCVAWDNGRWVKTHDLERPRYEASAFDSEDGLILMGSSDYPGNIFAIILDKEPDLEDGLPDSHRPWDLRHGLTLGCSIPEPETNTVVIISAKQGEDTNVVRYGQNGWLADLPSLNENRLSAACEGYVQDDGTKVMLVAGGTGAGNVFLTSTEIRKGDGDAPWVLTNPLPDTVGRALPRMITYNNIVYYTGGKHPNDGYRREIMKWEADTEEWIYEAEMLRGRNGHGVSKVIVDDTILDYCFTK